MKVITDITKSTRNIQDMRCAMNFAISIPRRAETRDRRPETRDRRHETRE
jgi:hypothetical protein